MQIIRKESSGKTTADGNNIDVKLTRRNPDLKTCPTFNNLTLSKVGTEYLDDINSKLKLGSWLTRTLGIGAVATVFVGGTSLNAEVTVNSTDWIMLSEGMRDVSKITRRQVETLAGLAVLELQDSRTANKDEIKFFKAIEDGCIP